MLFTDLVGSTDLMTQVGEAAFDQLRRGHFGDMRAAIARVGGEESKNTGDGVMAVFGSVVDGVHCAMAMQQAADRQARSGPSPLTIRVGLSVGEVTFEDGDVFGAPVVEAARLVAAAAAGQILTTAIARALASGRAQAEFVDFGALKLKGLPEPVPVCEVVWEPLPEPSVPMPVLLTDVGRVFVGRAAELEQLEQLWKEVAAGEARLAFLAGEPGIGKTRLAAELAARVHDQRWTVLAGRCDEDLGVPFQPFVEALRHFVDHGAVEDVAGRLGRYGGELVRLVPELAERVPGLPPPIRSDPETERYRLFDAVAACLAAVSSEEPLLLVLDDLQWAAKPTLLLLRHIARSPDVKRVLVLGTYRDSELVHDHPLVELLADLRRQEGVERFSLQGLDQGTVATFMARAAGHEMDDEGLALARAIHTETEGNPFFVREVIRHLTETGAIQQQDGRWVTTASVDELGIPEGVREVVGRRLSRLSAEASGALRVAAVIGTEFEVPVLQRSAGLDAESLLTALEEAINARLVAEVLRPRAHYRFSHALVRATLYEELTAARRVALHRRVAEAIETSHGGALDDYLPALAHHWARASAPAADTTRAIDYATRAGDRALAQLAHDEAVAYYRQALELLEAAEATPDGSRRLELLLALGETQRCAGDPGHRETLLQAGRLAHQLGDAGAAARAALANQRGLFSRFGGVDTERVEALEAALEAVGAPESAVRARLLASLAGELYWADDIRRQEFGHKALAIARRLADPVTLAEVIGAVWLATWDPAGARQRAHLALELTELATRLEDPLLQFQAGFARFLTAGELGDLQGIDAGLELCRGVAEQLDQPVLRWRTALLQANRATVTGRLDEAERLFGEARRLGESSGQPDCGLLHDAALATVRIFQGRLDDAAALIDPTMKHPTWRAGRAWLHAEQGRSDQARALLDDLRAADFAGVPRNHNWLWTLTFLSRAYARLGDSEAAAQIYDLLLPNRSSIVVQLTVSLTTVAHELGLLATTLGRYEDAEVHFAEAAEIEARVGASAMLVHTRLEWARMLLARGHPGDGERARELLGQALVIGRELGLGNVERQAVSLLQ